MYLRVLNSVSGNKPVWRPANKLLRMKGPGTAMTYKHSPAKNEPVAYYSALLNALSESGVTF
ncbi:hypothetical protein A9811_12195 [Escherichia coli]|nr:hypothetical protein [Escherichia coli]EFJ4025156.1 hypothetical protein [Escherichia coli]EGE4070813.1 hypothetical protein [Escherichia coli]PBT00150.1 hypothetical protein A9821_16205 [Escherichia coli]PBT04339.1 hypothetical protein A9818_18660 [Escherichia coli]